MNPARTKLAAGAAALAAVVLGPLAASALEPTPSPTPSTVVTEDDAKETEGPKADKPPKDDQGKGHAYGTIDRVPGVGLARGRAKGDDHPSAQAPGQLKKGPDHPSAKAPGQQKGADHPGRGLGHRTSGGEGHDVGRGNGHRFDESAPAPEPPASAS